MNAIDPETHKELIDAWTRFRDDPEAYLPKATDQAPPPHAPA
jgi:hypothetical protein